MNRLQPLWGLAPALLGAALVTGWFPGDASAQARKNLFSHVMTSAEVESTFGKVKDAWDAYTKTNHSVTFRVNTEPVPDDQPHGSRRVLVRTDRNCEGAAAHG